VRRTPSYNEELSRRLRKPNYAREFIATLMEGEDGMSAEDALRRTIEIMGVKEFSEISGVPSSNIVAFVKGRRSLKPETLDQLLKPFKLRTRIVLEDAS
jgi:predicted transcriptional regulator